MMISSSIRDYITNNTIDCNGEFDLAYTIYALLCKKMYYSPLFAKYKDTKLTPVVEEISLDNPFVNCYTWSSLYNELLHEYNIDSHIDGRFHKYVELKADGISVKADATIYMPEDFFDVASDLTNIKYGLDLLYFRSENVRDRERFNKKKASVSNRLHICNGLDNRLLKNIRLNKDRSIDERVEFGIDFYNRLYSLDDGEVERRQIFERYYNLLFEGIDREIIEFFDGGVLSKHLLRLKDDRFLLETRNGFKKISYDEIVDLIMHDELRIRYDIAKEKILRH